MIYMLVLWPTAIFFFYLAWVATGVYWIRFRWALRAVAFALLIFPIPAGMALLPACVGTTIYWLDWPSHPQNNALINCLRAIGITALVMWVVFELGSRANKYAEDRKHLNPLLNKK